jgi:hypothetical protein
MSNSELGRARKGGFEGSDDAIVETAGVAQAAHLIEDDQISANHHQLIGVMDIPLR